MDKGLTQANKMKAPAYIWSSFDENEMDILASYFVERGQVNPAMAKISRTLSTNYTQYQFGLLTLPKAIQSYLHITNNGGFDNPFKGLQIFNKQ